jgi:hypothetical protein
MARLTTALVALLCCLPLAQGKVAPRKDCPTCSKQFTQRAIKEAFATEESNDDLVITAATEIQLDGRACKYEDVPKGAEVVLLQIASDKKAILKIHFRSKK